MKMYKDYSAKTEDEAISTALKELELDRDEVSIEILERAKSGFFGIGAAPAVVRITYEVKSEEEELNDKIRDFLGGLFSHMGVRASIEIATVKSGVGVRLSGDNMGVVIGRRGETLDAIQHLTNYAVNRGSAERTHITIDAENYRSKREESLTRLAEKIATKVTKYRRSMALEPMNSYERHIIHTALQDFKGVTTSSTGTEPNRRVVVSFTGSPQPKTTSREWS